MKKITILIMTMFLTMTVFAQHEGRPPQKNRKITEIVEDLSPSQKRKVEAIGKESRERVDAMRAKKRAVCDSIAMYMDMDGDHTKELLPLFDREAQIQVCINREMYATKIRIDEQLTAEQRTKLRRACEKNKRKK